MFPDDILNLARDVIRKADARGITIATAESCTGGLVAASLTEIAGSSSVIDRGYVTYSDSAKSSLLGVPPEQVVQFGAVSEAVARAMASGALARAGVGLTVSVTGIAGPGGGTLEKPVGRVHFACADRSGVNHEVHTFADVGRTDVRLMSVRTALRMLNDRLDGLSSS